MQQFLTWTAAMSLLQEVLSAAAVAPATTKLECAKLADGAAAVVIVPAGSQSDSSRGASTPPSRWHWAL